MDAPSTTLDIFQANVVDAEIDPRSVRMKHLRQFQDMMDRQKGNVQLRMDVAGKAAEKLSLV